MMIIEFPTANNHDTNADGSPRAEHCCGCWHVKISDQAPMTPYVKCNECGEIREFTLR